MKPLIAAVLRRPIGTIAITLSVVSAGIAGIAPSSISLLPTIDVPVITVTARYEGLPAEQMRELVTLPLERGLSGIPGLRGISSTTRAGAVSVQLRFDPGTGSSHATSTTREAVDRLYPALPSAVSRPAVRRADPSSGPAIRVALHPTGASAARVRRLAEREIRAYIQQISGVGAVVVSGGPVEEVHVTVDQKRAQELKLDIASIRSVLLDGNTEYAAGSVVQGDLEIFVTTDARVGSRGELGQLYVPVDRAGGTAENEEAGPTAPAGPIPLSSLARIEPGYAPRTSAFHVDGDEAIGLHVYATSDANPAQVAGRVTAALPELERSFGSSARFQLLHDRSAAVRTAVSQIIVSAASGTIAAFAVLLLFLRSWRSASIVALSIPVSSGFSFALLAMLQVNLNTMALAGIAVGIGMVVDNSIVVVENLHEYGGGAPDIDRTARAVAEVSGATFSGTLTTVAVFLPLYALPGIAGLLYADLATAVISALLASYLASVTVIPLFYMQLERWKQSTSSRLSGALYFSPTSSIRHVSNAQPCRLYPSVLRRCLRSPVATVTAAAMIAGLSGVWAVRDVEVAVLEPVDTGEVLVTVNVPPDLSVEAAARRGVYIAEILSALPGIETTVTRVGGEEEEEWAILSDPSTNSNAVSIHLSLEEGVSARSILPRLRKQLGSAENHTRIELPEGALERLLGFNDGQGIAVHGDSPELALERARKLRREIERASAEDTEIALAPVEYRPTILATPDRNVLNHRNITLTDASVLLRSSVEGTAAGSLIQSGEEIGIRLFYGSSDRRNQPDITLLHDGIPLREALQLEEHHGRSVLTRRARRDVIYVQGDTGRIETSRHPWAEDLTAATVASLARSLMPVFALAMMIVAAILMLQFESVMQAAIVLSVLPFALAGSILGPAALGRAFTLQSAIGCLVLIGMVINGAIVLIETWNRQLTVSSHRAGYNQNQRNAPSPAFLRVTVMRGAVRRARPILMTTATTVVALLPLAIDPGIRSNQSGLALTIIAGLSVGTALTLFGIPAAFLVAGRFSMPSNLGNEVTQGHKREVNG